MKPTPQLYAAVGVLLLALIFGLGSILTGFGSYPVDATAKLVIPLKKSDQVVPVQAQQVVRPIVSASAADRSRNPFNLKPAYRQRILRIPMPPPPQLGSPAPPALPLERGR